MIIIIKKSNNNNKIASGEHCCSCQDPPDLLDAPVLNVENLALPAFPPDQIAVAILTTLPTQTIHPSSMFPHQVLFLPISLPFVN